MTEVGSGSGCVVLEVDLGGGSDLGDWTRVGGVLNGIQHVRGMDLEMHQSVRLAVLGLSLGGSSDLRSGAGPPNRAFDVQVCQTLCRYSLAARFECLRDRQYNTVHRMLGLSEFWEVMFYEY